MATPPLYVKVKGPHEEVQVTDVCRLEEFGLIQHGQGYPQGGPDVPGHHLVRLLATPAFPLKAQRGQEVAGCLPVEEK